MSLGQRARNGEVATQNARTTPPARRFFSQRTGRLDRDDRDDYAYLGGR